MSKIGFVYKITPHNCEEFYIGSTTDMRMRENKHNTDCKLNTSKLYIKIRECGGYVMELLYDYEFETDPELRMEEQRCLDALKPTLNSQRAFTSEEGHIEQRKQYYEFNKDVMLDINRQYYKNNKDVLLENKRQYYKINKNAINAKQREQYKINKNAINAKQREQYKLKKQQQQA